MKKLFAIALMSLTLTSANAMFTVVAPVKIMIVGLLGCAFNPPDISDATLTVNDKEVVIDRKVVALLGCSAAYPIAGYLAFKDAVSNEDDSAFLRLINLFMAGLVLDQGGRLSLSEVDPNLYDGEMRELAKVYNKNTVKLELALQDSSISFQDAINNNDENLVENNVLELYRNATRLGVPSQAVDFYILDTNQKYQNTK